MSKQARTMQITVNDSTRVSACLVRPRNAHWLYVLGHGAGAGMNHEFLQAMADRLAARRIATFRYQFPYMEAGRKRPDHASVLQATIRAAIAAANATHLPIIAGGKSMGGRMTSLAMSRELHPAVQGLAFLGFPLHGAGKPPSTERAEHLHTIPLPMLFLQGTRDTLADLTLMGELCSSLKNRATLHVVDGADHAFKVLKRSGRTHDQVLDELADALAAWGSALER